MAKQKKKDDNLKKEFLVRLLDQETAELVKKTLDKGIYPNRNKLINECIKGWLTRVVARDNPEATMTEIFETKMEEYMRRLFRRMDELKKLLLILSTVQNFDDKALGYLIAQFDNLLGKQEAIAPLPNEAVQLGSFDKLPERLEGGKVKALSDLLAGDNNAD